MNVYEQQARALKEIAAELKGIRRALDIIGKSLQQEEVELVGMPFVSNQDEEWEGADNG